MTSLTAETIYPQLLLNQWNGITPVILPVGPQTLPCIGLATAGVAVPFFLFLIAMFYLLVPLWLQNFHSDNNNNSNSCDNNNNAACAGTTYATKDYESGGGGIRGLVDGDSMSGITIERFAEPMQIQGSIWR